MLEEHVDIPDEDALEEKVPPLKGECTLGPTSDLSIQGYSWVWLTLVCLFTAAAANRHNLWIRVIVRLQLFSKYHQLISALICIICSVGKRPETKLLAHTADECSYRLAA